jgi:hypothetical protein
MLRVGMRPIQIRPGEILSFRDLLFEAIHEFLRAEGMVIDDAARGLGEVLVALASYREEGVPLSPSVFFAENLGTLLDQLGGSEHVAIGKGPRDAGTMRAALKHCAPLGRSGWSIYLVRDTDHIDYGLFRTDGFLLSQTPMGRLRGLCDPDIRIVGMVQLAENVIELRGSSGSKRLIYLSGASSDALPAISLIRALVTVASKDVPQAYRLDVERLLQRVFIDAMRAPHGSLIAVLPAGTDPRSFFDDGIVLEEPIRLADRVARFKEHPSEATRDAVQSAGVLLEGMLNVDGITLLGSDGSVRGYHAFMRHGAVGTQTLGGARRRTYEALATEVGRTLLGAFYRSQDGHAQCRTHDDGP